MNTKYLLMLQLLVILSFSSCKKNEVLLQENSSMATNATQVEPNEAHSENTNTFILPSPLTILTN